MTVYAKDIDAIEFIWNETKKEEDGTIRYNKYDIDALWEMGFVDTEKFTPEDWLHAFDEFKQPDGTYKLTKEEFYSLDKYRYKGEIKIPFDAMQINEGKYTDEGFQRLVDLSIQPSCGLPKPQFAEFIEDLKKKYRDASGLIEVGKNLKFEIKKLLDKHPSPLRRLEIIFDAALTDRVSFWIDKIVTPGRAPEAEVSARKLAAAQASAFSMLPSSQLEELGREYGALTKTKKPKSVTVPGAKTTTLKKIKRSKKGIRG